MRILKSCYEYPPLGGGGATVVQGLARRLVAEGHQVRVVSGSWGTLAGRSNPAPGLTLVRVRHGRRHPGSCRSHELGLYLAAAAGPLKVELARRPDILHAHFIFPDGLLARLLAPRAGIPYIVTVHGSDVPGYNPDRFGRLHRLLGPFWHWVIRGAATIVAPSTYLRDLVRARAPLTPVRIVPNGIDVAAFNPRRTRRKRLLVVTRMFPRKGVQFFLEALQGLALDHEVHIVGDGPFLPVLRAQAARHGISAVFWGRLEREGRRLRDLFESAAIFLLPSTAENFPMVLLEAMAAGTAIITTRDTGCAEVVGDAARLVAPGDVRELRRAIQELTASPERCARLGRRARQRVESLYSWHAVAAAYGEIYRRHGRSTASGIAQPPPAG